MNRLKHWFWSKTRLVRYGVPVSLVVLILSFIGLYISCKASNGIAVAVCVGLCFISFLAFNIITVEDGGTVVVRK